MDAVVTAGGIPQPNEPLYTYTQGKPKALVDICGKPMIQWVLDALGGSKKVENVVLIGLTEDSGVRCAKPMVFIPNRVGMIENLLGGIHKVMEINPAARQVLLVSSDIPAITSEMVDWEVETCLQTDVDLCYNVARRETIEARYPGSKRTYLKLKDMEVCGGDMNVVHTSVASMNAATWQKLVESRKNPFKQAAILGFDTLLMVLLHRITLDKAVQKATQRLHMTGKAIISPYAELAMDVDKPHQLELMRADLANRISH
ncbi:MAG TPA: nucleotidyltransferase family protein [Anaerolineales bacterium]|nr:nucleotidyltransferase family protein [Anaerolineales bacterium]